MRFARTKFKWRIIEFNDVPNPGHTRPAPNCVIKLRQWMQNLLTPLPPPRELLIGLQKLPVRNTL
jgi:hypothetical protein